MKRSFAGKTGVFAGETKNVSCKDAKTQRNVFLAPLHLCAK